MRPDGISPEAAAAIREARARAQGAAKGRYGVPGTAGGLEIHVDGAAIAIEARPN